MASIVESMNKITPSMLRQPAKVTKADFPVETMEGLETKSNKENQPEVINQAGSSGSLLKKKKTEAELRENLRQRKQKNNSTISGDNVSSIIEGAVNRKRPLISSRNDLNQTQEQKKKDQFRNLTLLFPQ